MLLSNHIQTFNLHVKLHALNAISLLVISIYRAVSSPEERTTANVIHNVIFPLHVLELLPLSFNLTRIIHDIP